MSSSQTPFPEPTSSASESRVALVTGATGGLGRACSAALAARGDHVVVVDLDGEAADRVAAELQGAGGSAQGIGADVTSRTDVERVIAQVVERHGRIDVLVNLAGIIRNQTLPKVTDEDFDALMGVHVKGTLNTMRAAVPLMREAGYGRIVNTSSIALNGAIAGVSYGAAKGAIVGMTRSAAMESAKHGITINCVAPGLVNAGVFLTVPEDYQQEQIAKIPAKRTGEPSEIAACVAFLTSPDASYVTGQTLTICGGLSLGF
ncbi:MAG: SDR family oxidoreductase [Patulibacter sp.]|nr:SDR family oxidoreductase [Patulibacter sp.]